MKLFHVTKAKNIPSIRRHGLIPQIGKNSSKIGETEKQIYFFYDQEMLNDALMNWLGDLLDESRIAVLTVQVPNDWIEPINYLTDYEACVKRVVPFCQVINITYDL